MQQYFETFPVIDHLLAIAIIALLFKAVLWSRDHEQDIEQQERLNRMNDPDIIAQLQDFMD